MKSISVLIKPISGICNINCSYCFYKDLKKSGDVSNKGKMSKDTMKKLIENILVDFERGDFIEFAFQGGEPTLLGVGFYKEFIDYVNLVNTKKVNISYSLQTNGILIDEKWCEFFVENNFLIGLSLDGPEDINDKYRLDSLGNGTFKKIIETKEMFDKYRVDYNILTVLTNEIALNPKKVWQFIKYNQIRYIQFIPCLDNIDKIEEKEYVLKPENFAYFYKEIFRYWFQSLLDNENYSIGLIEQLITYLSGQSIGTCLIRGKCSPQYVIESDGSVYPCDFYVLEKYNSGNIRDNSVKEIFVNNAMQNFLEEKKETPKICSLCRYKNICNGGCKRLKNIMYLNEDKTFCGYQDFLDNNFKYISEIIKVISCG